MYLNDARERPGRPIASGAIRRDIVFALGFAMLTAGVALAFALGLAAGLAGLALRRRWSSTTGCTSGPHSRRS